MKNVLWDGKLEIHKQAAFTDAYRWWTRQFPHLMPPSIVDVLVMMIQSGDFFPNQQYVCTPQGLPDLTKADAYWRLMFDPASATRRTIMAIFFASGVWDERSCQNRRGAMNVAVSKLGSFATASDYTNKNDEREVAKRDDQRRRAAGESDYFEL